MARTMRADKHRYARQSAKKITVHGGDEQMFGAEEQDRLLQKCVCRGFRRAQVLKPQCARIKWILNTR
jgi:hypothetical protein